MDVKGTKRYSIRLQGLGHEERWLMYWRGNPDESKWLEITMKICIEGKNTGRSKKFNEYLVCGVCEESGIKHLVWSSLLGK